MTIGIKPSIPWKIQECQDSGIIEKLATSPPVNVAQKAALKKALEEVEEALPLIWASRLNGVSLSQNLRTSVVKALTLSIVAEDLQARKNAVKELLKTRSHQEVKIIMGDIAKSYPIVAIMERAAQIMATPELPEGCFLVDIGIVDWFNIGIRCF